MKTNSYVDFCNKYNINYLIRYSNGKTIKKYALDLNKTSFTLELNRLNLIDEESAQNGVNIILNIIKNINDFNIKESEPNYPEYIELKTYKEGLFLQNKMLGDVVRGGDIIGKIINIGTFESESVEIAFCKNNYRIISYNTTNYVDADNPICLLQPIK